MIRAPSLIPAPRVVRRRRSARVRTWAAVAALTAACGAGGAVLARASISDPNAASEADLITAQAKLDELTAERDALRTRAATAAASLRAARVASDHPDWSILLAHVADLCGETIQLSDFSLIPEDGGEGFDVRINGVGPTQQDIARFVLGLEQSGVFASTRIERSGSEASQTEVPFSVLCLIRSAAPATPPQAKEEG